MRFPSRHHHLAALAGAIGLAMACRDSTGPDRRLVIDLSAEPRGVASIIEDTDGLTIVCEVDLVADARGKGTATWQDAAFFWYFGPDREEPADSDPVSASEIQSSWGGAEIAAADSKRATWEFTANAPFEVDVEMRYLVEGRTIPDTARTRFACGPVPTGATQSPAVTQVTHPTSDTELETGDQITVGFTANAAQGLWTSGIIVRGAFDARQLFVENGATSATRSTTFTVPSGARLDLPVTIEAYVVDAAFQRVARTVTTQLRVVDRTPPSFFSVATWGGSTTQIAGQFAAGDTLRVQVSARDNNALGWLVYSLGAPANVLDSVAAAPRQPLQTWTVAISVQPEWVGSPIMSLRLRDAGGVQSETRSSLPDSLRFYPTVTYPASAATSLPGISTNLSDIRYDPTRRLLYFGQPLENRIGILDVATMTFRTPITLSSTPGGMDLTPGGDSLVVVLPSTRALAVIDLGQPAAPPRIIPLTILDTEGFPGITNPLGIRIASTGVAIVTLPSPTRSGDHVLSVDLRTGVHRVRTDARGVANMPIGAFERSPDRSRVVIAGYCARNYIAATDQFTPCAGSALGDIAFIPFDAAGTRLTFENEIRDADLNVIRRGGAGQNLALTADGAFAFGTDGRFVTKMRVVDGMLIERIPVPVPADHLFVTPGDEWLLVFNQGGGRIARVDLR